jgi:hypothetical protein
MRQTYACNLTLSSPRSGINSIAMADPVGRHLQHLLERDAPADQVHSYDGRGFECQMPVPPIVIKNFDARCRPMVMTGTGTGA